MFQKLRGRGFTLIELMVVVVVIAILAALLVPALQSAQNKSLQLQCSAKMRAIGSNIRTYSTSWGGWTYPYHAYYIKLAGYPLKDDNNSYDLGKEGSGANITQDPDFNADASKQVKDFRCNADPDATSIARHEYPISYSVLGLFLGGNVMAYTGALERAIVLVEDRQNHPVGAGKPERNVLYGDLHVKAGFSRQFAQGLQCRFFVGTNYTAAIGPEVGGGIGQRLADTIWSYTLKSGGANQKINFSNKRVVIAPCWPGMYVSQYQNHNYTVRLDGYLTFPEPGQWQFDVKMHKRDRMWFWVDLNEDGQNSPDEELEVDNDRNTMGPYKDWLSIKNPNLYATLIMQVPKGGKRYRMAVVHIDYAKDADSLWMKWRGTQTRRQDIPEKFLEFAVE